MTELQHLDFHGHAVRVIGDGEDLQWVAADVARVLEYRDANTMFRGVDEEDKGYAKVRTPGGDQNMTTVNESGLYTAIVRANSERAKPFRNWVTREVLPAIRRHGGYLTQPTVEQILTDPDTLIKLATDLKAERARATAAENRAHQLEAPARSWTYLAAPGGDFSVGAAAKTLSRDPDIEIGRDRLFRHMAELGWIFRQGQGRREHWEAYQDKAIKTGRLVHKLSAPFLNERTEEYEAPAPTVRVTPKGLAELHRSLGGSDQAALYIADEAIDHS